jgi:predicted ATPase
LEKCRYREDVFLAPPWPEIFVGDTERKHGLAEAVAEFDCLNAALPRLGYRPVLLPKTTVAARADFILTQLGNR